MYVRTAGILFVRGFVSARREDVEEEGDWMICVVFGVRMGWGERACEGWR
jgi:hypothetical protein